MWLWDELPDGVKTVIITIIIFTVLALAAYGFYAGCAKMYTDAASVGGIVLWPI